MSVQSLKQAILRPAAVSRKRSEDAGGQGTFIIEAMLLLLCVLFAIAVAMSVFAFSSGKGNESYYQSKAIAMASNRAEIFAATPWAAGTIEKSQDCISTCEVIQESTVGGTMYIAHITVTRGSEVLYTLETTRYVSDGGRAQNTTSVTDVSTTGMEDA